MKKVHLIYFSPALSTRKIVRSVGNAISNSIKEYDITQGLSEDLIIKDDALVIFGIPVYSGRVPALATQYLHKIKGSSTPAVLVCVYGNREYEDALLELKNITQQNGFRPIAAGAFIARHSIFPNVAINRPDKQDDEKIADFAKQCTSAYQTHKDSAKELEVKGNYPYRETSKIPLIPKGDSKCDNCGTCTKMCPVNAIPESNPKKTDKDLCISCARCITVCPQHSRKFRGLIYSIARKKLESAYSVTRKEPEFFFNSED
ncbi:MAG: 4Fe-4S binding protein [Dysgonomonas sp.]